MIDGKNNSGIPLNERVQGPVLRNGQLVGTVNVKDVTDDDILGMIILGKKPAKAA